MALLSSMSNLLHRAQIRHELEVQAAGQSCASKPISGWLRQCSGDHLLGTKCMDSTRLSATINQHLGHSELSLLRAYMYNSLLHDTLRLSGMI